MSTESQNAFTIDQTWKNITATVTAAAGVEALYQNLGSDRAEIVFGGASSPASTVRGVVLDPFASMQGTAAYVWARSLAGLPDAEIIGVTVL